VGAAIAEDTAKIPTVTEAKETDTATEASTPDPAAEPSPSLSDDDRRAEAAAVNRKRAEKEWEENKKRWRSMGVPKGLPAKK
jgi:hypothetical protein